MRLDVQYIPFPDGDDILGCMISPGHFYSLKTAFYPVDQIQD